jgi:hypothetical protein
LDKLGRNAQPALVRRFCDCLSWQRRPAFDFVGQGQSVKVSENIAWLPGNLPSDQAVQAVLAPAATATISLPTSNFQPVTNSQVFMLQPLFPTNTPAAR